MLSTTNSTASTTERAKILWLFAAFVLACAVLYQKKINKDITLGDTSPPKRTDKVVFPSLKPPGNFCVPPSINEFPGDIFTQEERQKGFIAVHFVVTAYLCFILAIVCDHYFVPSLEIIADTLKVPADVAGATFMAIGTSSPELYSAIIGSFITEGDIGIGTVVGSAVFNLLGVTSVTGLILWHKEALVDWYPISRDSLVYIFSVATLICIIQDSIVTWFEAGLLLAMFFIYIAMMCFNHSIKESCEERFEDLQLWWKRYRRVRSNSYRLRHRSHSSKRTRVISEGKSELLDAKMARKLMEQNSPDDLHDAGNKESDSDDSDSDDDMCPWIVPTEGVFPVLMWVVLWPALFILTLTIPNCRKPNQSLFPYTFISSVVWIGVLSYLCSWMVTVIGHTFGLPDSVSGITLLAAGISVPEIIASVIVVKSGMANMAISNLIGSNIFDILFCLGLPWFIKALLSPVGSLNIHSAALTYTTAALLSTVILLFVVIALAGWKLNWKVGLACLMLYISFLIVACMCELNFFGDMNPPTCDS